MAVMISAKEKVLEAYYHLLKYLGQSRPLTDFCRNNNIPYKDLSNYYQRIIFKSQQPDEYIRLINLYELWKAKGCTSSEFSAKHDLQPHLLSATGTHLKYIKLINEALAERGEPPVSFLPEIPKDVPKPHEKPKVMVKNMLFHAIPQDESPEAPETTELAVHILQPQREPEPEPEFIKAKNEVELQISQGVRVLVSPDVDSMKIIRIIDLLKDL